LGLRAFDAPLSPFEAAAGTPREHPRIKNRFSLSPELAIIRPMKDDDKELLQKIISNKNAPALIGRGLAGLALLNVTFFSGFIAFGTFVISAGQQHFYDKAQPAQAIVSAVDHRSRVKTIESGSDRKRVTTNIDVLALSFTDASGRQIVARVPDGENSRFGQGDRVDVFYDPANPQDAKLAVNKGNIGIMRTVAKVSGGIFLAALLLFIFAMPRRTEKL
jgi:hypothetical protein